MVKNSFLILPVVALTIAGIWLGSQRRTISVLKQESTFLHKAIAERSSGSTLDYAPDRSASPSKLARDVTPINWKNIAAQLADTYQSDMRNIRAISRFEQRLQAMSAKELIAALNEISALDLPGCTLEMLEQIVLTPLIEKDPELALNQFVERLRSHEGTPISELSMAMQQWAKKDPLAAVAWTDRQIAAGKFDSKSLDRKSRPRIALEGALIVALLDSDSNAAGRRLATLPAEHRAEALNTYSSHQPEKEHQFAFAELVRNHLPEEKKIQTLGQQASSLVSSECYSRATEYLDRIKATPAERAACVEQAVKSKIQWDSSQKKISREDFDAMREWVTTQVPERTGTITGELLAYASHNRLKMEFSEAAELAVHYNDASGNDDVLFTFLDGRPAQQNKEQARLLAAKISDEKRRTDILKKLE
jgi:hypothetical protein